MAFGELKSNQFTAIGHAKYVKIYRDEDSIIIDVDGFVLAVKHADKIDIEEQKDHEF